jgi:hypothetical protein
MEEVIMKSYIFKYLLICLFFILFLTNLSAEEGNYIKMRIENNYWKNQNEWDLDVIADLYLNNELVTDVSDYYYTWYSTFPLDCTSPYYTIWAQATPGYGQNRQDADGQAEQGYKVKVQIQGEDLSGNPFILF